MGPDIRVSKLERIVAAARKAVVVSHHSPDGDAVGSTVACGLYLAQRGVEVTLVLPGAMPDNLHFLSPAEHPILIYEDTPEPVEAAIAAADTVFCLDFSGLSRTEYLEKPIRESRAVKVLIDHHASQETEPFAEVIATREVSSASELLYWVLMQMPDVAGDPTRLPMPCLEALWTGMMTDTNNFANSVFPSTFEMASALVAAGVDKARLYQQIFNVFSADRMRLMGYLLKDKMTLVTEYGAAFMVLTEAEKQSYNFRKGDSEGFVNLPLSIADVRISALFTESPEGYIRVSLRSKIGTDVNSLAREFFNGGGHVNAAGGRLYMPVDQVAAYFLDSLQKHFGR